MPIIEGEYNFAFGVSKLEADYEVRESIVREMDSAYLHESIHYIQDVGTLFGINRALFALSGYLNVVRTACRNQKIDIVPLTDEEDVVSSYFQCMRGDAFVDGQAKHCGRITQITPQNEDYKSYEEYEMVDKGVFSPRICVMDDSGNAFYFGGDAIAESMSYLVEAYTFGSKEYENVWPYNACELLYEYVVGKRCDCYAVLIALCYAALQNEWPGNTFVSLIERIRQSGKKPERASEVFSLSSDLMQGVCDSKLKHLYDRIDLCFPLEKDDVTSQTWLQPFVNDLEFTNKWLKKQYTSAVGNESQHRKSWIDTLEGTDITNRISAMRSLLDQYGHPIFIDSRGKLYTENKGLCFLLAPYTLSLLIQEKKIGCALYRICTGYGFSINDECLGKYWLVKKPQSVCIMRFYLYIMGLGEVDFDKLLFSRDDKCI